MTSNDLWIYHERQEALLCGQHALNNLVQAALYSTVALTEIAHQLHQMELTYWAANNEGGLESKAFANRIAEGSSHVDDSGNFSIEVLRSALMNEFNLPLPSIKEADALKEVSDMTEAEGFICNKDSHWFAIRKLNNRFWNLNSTLEQPTLISHFRLATEIEALQAEGFSVFVVVKGLPSACTSVEERDERSQQQDFWWKESHLLSGDGGNAARKNEDKWSSAGAGRRLDGGNALKSFQSDEEALLHQSMASVRPPSQMRPDLTPEPEAGDETAVRIQFRLPNGSRVVRRFLNTEPVGMLYSFVESQCPGKSELKCGFPPKDLTPHFNKTIGEASLAGESVQCRHV